MVFAVSLRRTGSPISSRGYLIFRAFPRIWVLFTILLFVAVLGVPRGSRRSLARISSPKAATRRRRGT